MAASDNAETAGMASPSDGAGLRFIPFRRRDIVAMCRRDGGSRPEQAQRDFAAASALIERHFQSEFHQIKQQLKDAYAPLDPDADTRSVTLAGTALDPAARTGCGSDTSSSPGRDPAEEAPPELMANLERVLDRANYEKVSGKALLCFLS